MSSISHLNPLERQFLAQVSRELTHQDSPNLGVATQRASALLRLTPHQHHTLSKLVGTWTNPTRDAQHFEAQLKLDGLRGGLSESNLLLKVAGLERLVVGAGLLHQCWLGGVLCPSHSGLHRDRRARGARPRVLESDGQTYGRYADRTLEH